VAKNFKHVHDLYNFDYEPTPGTAQYKVDQRIRRAQELQLRRLQRMAMEAAADIQQQQQQQVSVQRGPGLRAVCGRRGEAAPPHPSPPTRPCGHATQQPSFPFLIPHTAETQLPASSARLARPFLPTQGGSGAQPQAELAEAAATSSSSSGGGGRLSSQPPRAAAPWGTQAGTPFASMSMGIGRASRAVLDTLQAAAKHGARRPRVVRPSQLPAGQKQRR
jgi:hypothetical protein